MYVNGTYFGYTYESPVAFNYGLESWNNDENLFFVGVTDNNGKGNLYYLKGLVYSVRLYTRPLEEKEVELNYDTNLKYRNSFKDEVLQ